MLSNALKTNPPTQQQKTNYTNPTPLNQQQSSLFKSTGSSIINQKPPQTNPIKHRPMQPPISISTNSPSFTNPFQSEFGKSTNIKSISKETKDYFINRLPINLEDLLIQEERLWMCLTCIRFGTDYGVCAEEYLEFSHVSSIQSFEVYFNEKKIKDQIIFHTINEYMTVMLSVLTLITNKICEVSLIHLKNLFYYTHQNLLLIINSLILKMDKEYIANVWGNRLKEIVYNRLSQEMKLKRNSNQYSESSDERELFFISQNNSIIANMLKNYIDIYFRNNNPYDVPVYKFISVVLNNFRQLTSNKPLNKSEAPINPQINIYFVKASLSKLKLDLLNTIMISRAMNKYATVPKEPFLPPIDSKRHKYSLVLDLDETLVHSIAETGTSLIRPGTEEFLKELTQYYEIIIFTAAVKDYADNLLNSLDKGRGMIHHRLYRQHTSVVNNVNVKDISKLGRDLSKVIIIDNISDNFQKQSENGIFITTWLGNEKDTELYDLIPILREIVVKKVKDVRKVLRKLRDTLIRLYVKGDPTPLDTLKKCLAKTFQEESKG